MLRIYRSFGHFTTSGALCLGKKFKDQNDFLKVREWAMCARTWNYCIWTDVKNVSVEVASRLRIVPFNWGIREFSPEMLILPEIWFILSWNYEFQGTFLVPAKLKSEFQLWKLKITSTHSKSIFGLLSELAFQFNPIPWLRIHSNSNSLALAL